MVREQEQGEAFETLAHNLSVLSALPGAQSYLVTVVYTLPLRC